MEDVVAYVSRELRAFEQPGDTSCPQQEQIDAMKLEVQVTTVALFFGGAYLLVALLMKRKQLRRMTRDALISLARAKMPGAALLVTAPAPDELAATSAAEALLASKPAASPPLAVDLKDEPPSDAADDAKEEARLSRRGPAPDGGSEIEKGVEAWRARLAPAAETLGDLFGFQSRASHADAADAPESTRELVVDRLAKNLWNLTQTTECPVLVAGAATASGPPAEYAADALHSRTFAGYDRWLAHTKFEDLSLPGQPTSLGYVHGGDAARRQPSGAPLLDTKLHQLVLFELMYTEAANCRLLPEMLSFAYHAAAACVTAPSASSPDTVRAVRGAGLPLPEGDFVRSVVAPFHGAVVESMNLAKRLHRRVGYDDVNETFWRRDAVAAMFEGVDVPVAAGADAVVSAYARFRHFCRTAHGASERDRRLSSVFEKTFQEHLGWGMVFVNFHRMFTFLSVAFHMLIVHAFVGFSQPLLFASAAMTAAACAAVLETHALFIHGQALMCSRRASYARLAAALLLLVGGAAAAAGVFDVNVFFAAACAPYLLFALLEIWGYYPLGGPDPDGDLVGKRSGGDLAVDDPKDKRAYRLFWVAILLVKFAMDYVFIVHSLVTPSRAIMQIDLYCWNYNFAGEDCDQYDYADAIPLVAIQAMRLFRRYAYKLLMLFERWLPNLMLYYCNMFFYYLAFLGIASAFHRLRWRGVSDGWSKVVRNLPTRIEAFERRVLTKDARPLVDPSPSAALCAEAVSESWDVFAKAWNEVVRSLRDRDLISDEETRLLTFSRLRGAATSAFFGGAIERGGADGYLLFPAMLSAPVFSKAGASRNVNMTYSMVPAVFAQTVDTFAFLCVSVLGVCDGEYSGANSARRSRRRRSTSSRAPRRQAPGGRRGAPARGAERHAPSSRFHRARKPPLAVDENAPDDLRNFIPQAAVVRRAIDACCGVCCSWTCSRTTATLEDDAGKEPRRPLARTGASGCARSCGLRAAGRSGPRRRAFRGASAGHATRQNAPVEHVFVALTTANPSAEPASPEARDVLRFFLDSFTDPQLVRAAPAARAPSMVTLTPLYKEDVAFGASTLASRVDGENVSTLRFLISMMPTEWAAMLQRCKLTLPGQDYESMLQSLHDDVAAGLKEDENDVSKTSSLAEKRRLLREICEWASGRSQTMLRTARGMASYADATRVLARLEGVPEADIEPLVMAKYSHVVCAQVYGTEGNEENDEQLEQLLRENPHLCVVTAHRESVADRRDGRRNVGDGGVVRDAARGGRFRRGAPDAPRASPRLPHRGRRQTGEPEPRHALRDRAVPADDRHEPGLPAGGGAQDAQRARVVHRRDAAGGFPRAGDHRPQRLGGVVRRALGAGVRHDHPALPGEALARAVPLRAPRRVGPRLGARARRRLQGFAAAAPERGHLRRHEPDASRRSREVRGVHDGGQGSRGFLRRHEPVQLQDLQRERHAAHLARLSPPGEAAGLFPLALVFPIQRGHLLRRVSALRVARRVRRVQADDRDAARGDFFRGR
jgi:hypothetical protein